MENVTKHNAREGRQNGRKCAASWALEANNNKIIKNFFRGNFTTVNMFILLALSCDIVIECHKRGLSF